ncbi:Proposed lipoate regulatory protein YbeD [hydrothermal vent metagenome]|uniref:Proposed lipoate regulatory protein YbeD n=1 Tax=hydrothermal vent metagenome TaxID=652676 RepID=A0A3B0ZKI9_9ZZZZ
MSDQETLFEFPCEFPIKVMGEAADDFDAHVVSIIRKHVTDLPEGAARSRTSSGGKFQSVTVTFTATSKAQLDAIYMALTACSRIKMVL